MNAYSASFPHGLSIAALSLVLSACSVESSWITCSDGRLCPSGQACDDENRTCSSSTDPCHGVRTGVSCRGIPGVCRQGTCVNRCGNQILDDGEECDNEDFGGLTCADRGWYYGRLNCTSSCQIREDRCNGRCDDGLVDGDLEVCEPSRPGGELPTCVSQGYDAGRPRCESTCDGWADLCVKVGWTESEIPGRDLIDIASADEALFALTSSAGVLSSALDWATLGREAGTAITGRALWANSSRDIWVINSAGDGFHHWNGTRWKEVPIPAEGLRDIWGSSSSDVFAVGDRGIVFHFDGASWESQRCLPQSLPALCGDLLAVWGVGPDEVYAVGGPASGGNLVRYDGDEWRNYFGAPGTLTGVWAHRVPGSAVATRIWTISATVVRRNDIGPGTEMLRIEETETTPSGGWIVGTGPSDVWWSAGADGSVRHYDGRRWSTMLPGTASGAQPIGIGRNRVIVGDATAGDGVGRMRQWSGAANGALLSSSGIWADAWTFDPEPDPSFWFDASPPQPDFWIAVGRDEDTGEGLALHSDGRMFRFAEALDHVTGFSKNLAYAASQRQILQWNGERWSLLRSGNGLRVADLWSARSGGQTDLYAIDRNTATGSHVLRFDGLRWLELPPIEGLFCDFDFTSGWASGPDNVFVAGRNIVARFDGSQWWEISFCGDTHYESVWGSAFENVWYSQYLPDSGQTVLHGWGSTADEFVVNGSGRFVGTARDDVFFGSAAYFDGRMWSPIQASAIAGTPVIALPSRLLTIGAVDGTIGLGQFVRTRFWNGRRSEVLSLSGSDTDCSDGVDNDANGVLDRGDSRCVPPQ